MTINKHEEALLNRTLVTPDWTKARAYISNKTVWVTGGGGSIGSALCHQLATLEPANLVIVDHSEFNLYTIERKLRTNFPLLSVKTYLVDVTSRLAIKNIMSEYCPDILFHAAAYKHVPLLEFNVESAIFNNILGLHSVAEEAIKQGVPRFVFISTDKAVNPISVMGMSKRLGELLCEAFSHHAHTCFLTVRFGNVLDSAGSVVPLFREQIAKGGPVTVTDPNAVRYFMSIQEAAQLVIQAASIGNNAETFVFDMGKPIAIKALAEQMITFAKQPKTTIDIVYTGLRPGEKLAEVLIHENETLTVTALPKLFNVKKEKTTPLSLSAVQHLIKKVATIKDKASLQEILERIDKRQKVTTHV